MVFRKVYFLLFCFLLPALSIARAPVDSLAQILQDMVLEEADPNEIHLRYHELIRRYQQDGEWDSAIEKAEEAMYFSMRDKAPQPQAQFQYLYLLAESQFGSKQDDNLALSYLLQAKQIDPGATSESEKAKLNSLLAKVYASLGDDNEALKIQLLTIDQARSVKDTLLLIDSYHHLGEIYIGQGDFEKAQKSLLTGLQLTTMLDTLEPELRLKFLCSAAGVNIKLNELDVAEQYLESSYLLADSIGSEFGIACYQQLKGEVLLLKGQVPEAYRSLRVADQYFRVNDLKAMEADTKLSIAQALIMDQEASRSLALLDSLQEIAKVLTKPSISMKISELRAKGFSALGRKDLAYDNLVRYLALRDSIYGTPVSLDFARAESGIAVSKIEEEIAEIKEAQQLARRQMTIGGIIAGFILLLVLLLMGYQRNRALNRVNKILAQKTEEIYMQNERLASSNEELRQFAHITSHDLREPLRSIGGFSTLLERKYQTILDDRAREYLSFITSGVRRMDSLLADLMNYSVIGILEQKFEPVEIEGIITDIIETLHREKRTQGARINIRNLPTITADARQMRMLFENLIDNAIKFKGEDTPKVEINCERKGDHYLFSIADNGIGMDEAYQEQIFSLFLRLHNNTSEYEGTGIGLSICRKIVQQHKGKIWIKSQKDLGTTVYFLLPTSPLEVTNAIKWRPER